MGLLEASCASTSKALSDTLEGELHGLHRLRVGRHLARCSRCRLVLASLAGMVKTLRSVNDEELDNGRSLVGDVFARIQEGSPLNGHS